MHHLCYLRLIWFYFLMPYLCQGLIKWDVDARFNTCTLSAAKNISTARLGLGLADYKNSTESSNFFRMLYASPTQNDGIYTYNISGTLLTYLAIFKVGSEHFQQSLQQNFVRRTQVKKPFPRDNRFTFVREPISHLFSGLNEAMYRNYLAGKHNENTLWRRRDNATVAARRSIYLQHQVNVEQARKILDGLLLGDIRLMHQHFGKDVEYAHFHLMSSRVRSKALQPEYVGRLENMDNDIRSIEQAFRLPIPLLPLLNHSDLGHPTSEDGFGLVRSLKLLINNDPRYIRALCTLLWRDYACFSIPLPEQCADLA